MRSKKEKIEGFMQKSDYDLEGIIVLKFGGTRFISGMQGTKDLSHSKATGQTLGLLCIK